MNEKIKIFMRSRYGMDMFGKFLLICALILSIVGKLFNGLMYKIALGSAYAVFAFAIYRFLSKNTNKRYSENLKYMRERKKVLKIMNSVKTRLSQYKTYRFFVCPNCKQQVKVPRGKGKIKIKCPRCHNEFVKVS